MDDSCLPFVSVLAPCRNEALFIEKAIQSILENDYPKDKIEILVIDGMSHDRTREIVEKMAQKDSRIKLLDNPDRIVPTAMNLGIQKAKGDYIVRIDCHTHFAQDYIKKCIETLSRTGAWNAGGYCNTVSGDDTKTAKAISVASSVRFGVGNSEFRTGGLEEKEVDTVPFGTYRKDLFEKIGYYDVRLVRNQDIELNSRIRKAGGKIIISPDIKLSYYNRSTYKGIWQQSFNNGLWNPYTIWLLGYGLSWRHFVPMFFLISLLVCMIGLLFSALFIVFLGLDMAAYLAAALFFSIREGRKSRGSSPHILWAFIVLHIAYGTGSLWGVLTAPFKFSGKSSKEVGKPLSDRK
jgi:glycosyltransferase involved in cell wall biosynthesis